MTHRETREFPGDARPWPKDLDYTKAMDSYVRCAFLLYAIAGGDHKALGNAEDAAQEAADILRDTAYGDDWMGEGADDAPPLATVRS